MANTLIIIFISFSISLASSYEAPINRQASKILPTKLLTGKYYKVNETVISHGYMNNFTVTSDFGEFQTTGNLALYKLIHEIDAIASLNELKGTDAFGQALKASAESPVKFAKNMIENPSGTLSGIPKGAFSIVNNIKTGLFSKKDPSTDSSLEEMANLSKCKRKYAKAVNVDVYSRNEELQKALNSIGWACAAGGLSLSVATIPIGSPIVTLAKTAQIAQNVSDAIYSEPPSKLRQVNEKKLIGLGISSDMVKQFLDHPIYTPTQDTTITLTLEKLKGSSGLNSYLQYLTESAETPEDAYFTTLMTLLISQYNDTKSKIKDINKVGIFIVIKDSSGNYMVPFPLDYGVWSEMADRQITNLTMNLKTKKKIELWVTGTVSPLAKKNLKLKGIKLIDNIADKLVRK